MSITNIQDKIKLIVSNVSNSEKRILYGSVTLPGDLLLESKTGNYSPWITIFDDPDDDEYDGDLLEDDCDYPMIKLHISLNPLKEQNGHPISIEEI